MFALFLALQVVTQGEKELVAEDNVYSFSSLDLRALTPGYRLSNATRSLFFYLHIYLHMLNSCALYARYILFI